MTAVLIHLAAGVAAFAAGFLIGRLVGWADGFSAGYQERARQGAVLAGAWALLMVLPNVPLAQTWAQVRLENGDLVVARLADGGVRLTLEGARSWAIDWSPLTGAIATAAIRVQAATLPPDTVEYRQTTAEGVITLRCAPAGCWVVITHAGRSGYWRPRPTFDAVLLRTLANAIEAARLGIGAFWIEDLRR